MVKVTGGGRSTGAVGAHFSYISGKGRIEIETDEGQRIDKEGQKELLKGWHLELTPGQYRKGSDDQHAPRRLKLAHNIVLSMPRPTPPDKVLAAARAFAREHFGAKHQYAMALHTHQDHPHVHLVVKAEGRDGQRPAYRQGHAAGVARALCRTDAGARCARQCHSACRARPKARAGSRRRATRRSAADGLTACARGSTMSPENLRVRRLSMTPHVPSCWRRGRPSSMAGSTWPLPWTLRGRSSSPATCATSRTTCRPC